MNSGYVEVNGAEIYYESCGSGVPLILLHGNGEDMSCFSRQIDIFSQYFNVITIDMRAHGRSSGGYDPLTFDLFARDVAAVMNALRIPKAHILGFSDGGNTAITFALHFPDRVISLILSGANLNPAGVNFAFLLEVNLQYLMLGLAGIFNKSICRKREIVALMVKHPHIDPKQLRSISVPTLVIAGQNDMIRRKHTELIAGSIPNALLRIIPDADHFAAQKLPDVFNAIVLDFLKKQ